MEFMVSITKTFETARSREDAVGHMIRWLSEESEVGEYTVTDTDGNSELIEADGIDWDEVHGDPDSTECGECGDHDCSYCYPDGCDCEPEPEEPEE